MPFLKRRAQSFWPVARQFLVEGLGWSRGVFFQSDYERKTTCSTFFPREWHSLLKRCKKSISSCISTWPDLGAWIRGCLFNHFIVLCCLGNGTASAISPGKAEAHGDRWNVLCPNLYVRRGHGIFSRLQETLKIDIPFLMVVLLIKFETHCSSAFGNPFLCSRPFLRTLLTWIVRVYRPMGFQQIFLELTSQPIFKTF